MGCFERKRRRKHATVVAIANNDNHQHTTNEQKHASSGGHQQQHPNLHQQYYNPRDKQQQRRRGPKMSTHKNNNNKEIDDKNVLVGAMTHLSMMSKERRPDLKSIMHKNLRKWVSQVYTAVGHDQKEKAYQTALQHLLLSKGLEVACEAPYTVHRRDPTTGRIEKINRRADLIVSLPEEMDKVLIECKAKPKITKDDMHQVIFYRHHFGIDECYLVNFRHPDVDVLRLREENVHVHPVGVTMGTTSTTRMETGPIPRPRSQTTTTGTTRPKSNATMTRPQPARKVKATTTTTTSSTNTRGCSVPNNRNTRLHVAETGLAVPRQDTVSAPPPSPPPQRRLPQPPQPQSQSSHRRPRRGNTTYEPMASVPAITPHPTIPPTTTTTTHSRRQQGVQYRRQSLPTPNNSRRDHHHHGGNAAVPVPSAPPKGGADVVPSAPAEHDVLSHYRTREVVPMDRLRSQTTSTTTISRGTRGGTKR